MLFLRDFTGFTGGHLKVFTYMNHTTTSGLAVPVLYQPPRSRAVSGNIFNQYTGATIDKLRTFPAYFVAGEDWFILDQAGIDPGSAPVINLIQGLRHVDPDSPLFACLRRPALRICVSPAVANAIRDHVNGDVVTIENSVDVGCTQSTRNLDGALRVLIAGTKNPRVGLEIEARLKGVCEVDLLLDQVPREAFLARIADASVCIMLPLPREGFYLPALEAMALGRAVITPDCGGNLCYCLPGVNCAMPRYTAEALADAAKALLVDRARLGRLARGGLETATQHSIEKERTAYHAVLAQYLKGYRDVGSSIPRSP